MRQIGEKVHEKNEDIHRIREYNYEVTKHMTVEEKLHYYNTPRTDAEEQIERLRAKGK